MARLVVFTKERPVSADPGYDNRKYTPGMVVDVLEDGVFAGNDVEGPNALGWWRIVELSGRAADYADYLGGDPEFNDPLTYASKSEFPRKRVKLIDITTVEAVKQPPTKQDAIPLTTQELATVTQPVAKAVNPDVIGEDADVIGG